MREVALFDASHGRKLQWSGAVLVTLSLCILSGFFIDLMQALALRSPIPGMNDWLPVFAGLAVALLIPISGACAGIPDKTKGWLSKPGKVTGLLLVLGGAIALARYSKALDQLTAHQRAEDESARAARLEAAAVAAQSPEAKARAEVLAAQAAMLASSAKALEKGAQRLTPKVREHAVAMAKLATNNLPAETKAPVAVVEASPQSISTIKVLEVVVGPALTEFLLAELIAFVASIWGAAAFARVRSEDERLEEERHPSLHGVDLTCLSDEARDGLDVVNGTWRGLDLGRPAERGRGRRAVVWPTLALRGNGSRVFIGSPQAVSHARGKVVRPAKDGGDDVVAQHQPSL